MESHPPLVHRSRVLKLQPNCCAECMRKVKRAMLKVEGVHSIKVNANEGTIEVKSEIDPQVLIEMAAKAGKRAELLWESEPESSENIPTPSPTPPPLAMSSTDLANQRQVQVNGFDHTLHLQDLVDKNARGIKHMEIVDKRVIKITFKDDPNGDPSQREGSNLGCCGNVEVVATMHAGEPPSLVPPEISDAPPNSKPVEPPIAIENCGNGGNRCRVM